MNDIKFQFRTRKFNDIIVTECAVKLPSIEIDQATYEDVVLMGYAVKSPKDQHWKAKAQRAAVDRAIKQEETCWFNEQSVLDDKYKAKIWEAFFNHSTATRKLRRITNEREHAPQEVRSQNESSV